MEGANYIIQEAISLLPYVIPTLIALSIVMFADVTYAFLWKILSKTRKHVRW